MRILVVGSCGKKKLNLSTESPTCDDLASIDAVRAWRKEDACTTSRVRDMYTGNQYIGQPEAGPKRVFRDRFPTVYKIFSCIKKGDKTDLPKLLQRIESYIVLDRICLRIAQERPYLPIFTLHDSVITTVGNEGYVEAIMREELTLCIGYTPQFKIERWTNEY